MIILAQTGSGLAHRPYFTQTETVIFPDGQIGEMRLLHGDGIIISDPVRLIVLDSVGRLIGYSEESSSMTIICTSDRKCVGYNGSILEFDPKKPFVGPVVIDGLSAELWNAPRDASVNIRERAPTWSEFAAAQSQLAQRDFASIAIAVITGAFIGSLGMVLIRLGVRSSMGFFSKLLVWIIMLGLEVAVLLCSAITTVIFLRMSDFEWFVSLCFGAACVVMLWLVVKILRRTRRQAAEA